MKMTINTPKNLKKKRTAEKLSWILFFVFVYEQYDFINAFFVYNKYNRFFILFKDRHTNY